MTIHEEITPDATIYVAGHRGLVGSAIVRCLTQRGYTNVIGKSSAEVDLRDRDAVFDLFSDIKPTVVINAAAKVGGILANSEFPVEFLNDNLRIQTNIFEAAHANDVPRLIFLGSSCIYPKFAEQPIREDSLLSGALEHTNQAYAIAKISGVIAVESYREEYGRSWISAMPRNLYGPGDNYDLQTSHVLPALIRKFHEAKESNNDTVILWGTGSPRREFLHVDDMASAVCHLIHNYDDAAPINVGFGSDVTIKELAETVKNIVGFTGDITWDTSKPDGTPENSWIRPDY